MTKTGYFLGIDAGNTVIKAVLFDIEGNPLSTVSLDGQTYKPAPGHVERDLDALWENAAQVISGCISEAGISAEDIIGVGCAGHGNGLYLLDKSGDPLLGIQSLDTRASDLATDLSEAHGDALHAICLQKPWPSQTPVLLSWLKINRPEIYEKTGTVLLCKDFINNRLTGEKTSEISDMSGAGLTRMPDCVYDSELLSYYDLEDAFDLLPRLIDPADVAGRVTPDAAKATGLRAGTPVIGGYFDVVSSALGSGVVSSGEASIIAGTWSINQVFSDTPAISDKLFMACGFGIDRFVNLESSATSAANLEWYVRELIKPHQNDGDPFEYCNLRVADVVPSLDDPFFHPYLYGSGQGAEFRGGFYGIAGWHTEGHILRALYEGVVFEHRRHIETLRSAGVHFDSAVLSGGGSRSPIWPQIFADCLGVPITISEAQETGALGASIGVAVATETYPNYERAVECMTNQKSVFTPNVDLKPHYDSRYARYLELINAMRGFWASDSSREKGK